MFLHPLFELCLFPKGLIFCCEKKNEQEIFPLKLLDLLKTSRQRRGEQVLQETQLIGQLIELIKNQMNLATTKISPFQNLKYLWATD